jgi:hypothetical protein
MILSERAGVPVQDPCRFVQDEARTNGETAYNSGTSPSFVYFVAFDGFVKIGVAKNVKKRVSQLQSGCPHQLDLIGVVEGDRETEAAYHKKFRKLRVSGEWFRLAPPLTDEIMRLVRIELGVPPEGDLALHLRDRLKREAEPHP